MPDLFKKLNGLSESVGFVFHYDDIESKLPSNPDLRGRLPVIKPENRFETANLR